MAAVPPPGSVIVLDDEDEGPPPAPPTPPGPSGTPPAPTPSTPSNGDPPGTPPSGGGGKEGGYKEENERLFGEFLALCTPLTAEHPEVLPFLCSRHQKAGAGFRSSAELRNVLARCLRRVRRRRSKVYVYINELCTTLKAHSLRRKLPLGPASNTSGHPNPPHPSPDPLPSPPPPPPPPASSSPSSSSSSPTGSKRQIRYLENLLRVYTGEIRRLQERELDLEELDSEDSAYLQESRLKRRMMRIFQRLCELKRCSSLTGRVMEQRIPYRGTRYPEVNRRIERFINRPEVFPDYSDILKVIQKANGRHRLGLGRKHMESMAQDAFREVGNRLQERRHLDLVYNFGSHLTDQYRPGTDPALMDPELAKRLRRNRTMALSRLDQVISHYAQLQDESEEEERGRKRRRGTPGKSQAREEEEEEETEEETEEEEEEEEEGDSSNGSHGKKEEEDEGDPLEVNAPHAKEDEEDEGTASKPSIPCGSPKGDPMELNAPPGKEDEDEEGTASKPSIPYGNPKGDPMELNAPPGKEEEEEEGTASKPSIPYGSPKGDEGPTVPYSKDAADAPHGQAKQEAPIAPGAIPMEVMPKTPEELFMVEIETLPMEPNETPPGSPHPMGGVGGGSEAKPKGASPPPHSQSPSLSRPSQDHRGRERGAPPPPPPLPQPPPLTRPPLEPGVGYRGAPPPPPPSGSPFACIPQGKGGSHWRMGRGGRKRMEAGGGPPSAPPVAMGARKKGGTPLYPPIRGAGGNCPGGAAPASRFTAWARRTRKRRRRRKKRGGEEGAGQPRGEAPGTAPSRTPPAPTPPGGTWSAAPRGAPGSGTPRPAR